MRSPTCIWRPDVTDTDHSVVMSHDLGFSAILLNRISECFCVFANPNVPRHDHDQRRSLDQQLRCSQMNCVERPNRLDRKGSPHPSENRVGDSDQVAATLKTAERTHCRSLFVGAQPCDRARPKNRPRGFSDC
jgi:hypothetical protein